MSLHHMLRAAAGNTAGPSDPYFEYNALLLTGNGTNGAQNNTFLDGSTNNFTITRNGNTTQGSFSPYGTNWSNYFDGSGDYLSVPDNSALELGSGDFTIECWIFPTTTNYGTICSKRIAGQTYGSYQFIYNGSTDISFIASTNNLDWQVAIYSSQPAQLNKWNHVAVTRSGSTWKLWLNGTQVASDTYSVTVYDQASTLYIGNQQGDTNRFTGYISNFRLVKGTALYTSAFTPSTTPLTAVSGTSLLTCQSNRFIDNSSNNFTLTVAGDTSVQRFSPFNPASPYSASTIGGSGYFDGNGDTLSVADNANLRFGTNNFTIQAWVYRKLNSTTFQIASKGTGTTGWSLIVAAWNTLTFAYGSSGIDSVPTIPINCWTHVAVVRSSTSSGGFKMYINGVEVSTTASTVSNNFTETNTLYVAAGRAGGTATNGYISDLRIVNGTAETISLPTTPLTATTNTQLLCNFTNAGIPDAAMMNDLETVGNVQVSTSVKKYGTGSLAFDGTGDYLKIPISSNLVFNSGDFTVEAWVYSTSASATQMIWATHNVGTASGWYFCLFGGVLDWGSYGNGGTNGDFSTSSSYPTNQWFHVAVTKSSGTLRLFINGTQGYSGSDTKNYATAPYPFTVGADQDGSESLNGYIDDLRITKGYARYTANFTPPIAALPIY